MPEHDVQHIENIALSNPAAPDTAENQRVEKKRNNSDRKSSSSEHSDIARRELITIGPFWRDGKEHYETRVRVADTDDRKCVSPSPIRGRQLGAPVLDWSQVTPQEDEPAAADAFVSEKCNTTVQLPFELPPDTEHMQRGRKIRRYAKRYDSLDIQRRRQEPPKRWNRRLGRYVDINSPADLKLNDERLYEPAQEEEQDIPAEKNFLDLPFRRKGNGPPACSQPGNYVLSEKPKLQRIEDLDDTTSDVPRAMHVSSQPKCDVEEALIWGASEVSQPSTRKRAVAENDAS